ncbi:MAG: DUF1549 domain-containing protein, partial [Planctomycetes bacterium]|nr:DUF1549 domain-containing protein [Planctomycetota bacterium]
MNSSPDVLRVRTHVFWFCFFLVAAIHVSQTIFAADDSSPSFSNDVLPLLKNRCVKCHGPTVQEGKLNLALATGIARGGKSGKSIVPGQLDDSLAWKRVSTDEMPADEPLPDDEKQILKRWIEKGANGLPVSVTPEPDGEEHWAFRKLAPVQLPQVDLPQSPTSSTGSLRTPIDSFIQSRLAQVGLSIGPEADRRTLIRRVAFDLTGLPPTLDEINLYVNDSDPSAYEKMVDRYLASPHYGERWGKYWLDAAGYAESNGYFGADTDRPLAYRYRDYVIRSINADRPFDRF